MLEAPDFGNSYWTSENYTFCETKQPPKTKWPPNWKLKNKQSASTWYLNFATSQNSTGQETMGSGTLNTNFILEKVEALDKQELYHPEEIEKFYSLLGLIKK